MFLPSEDGLSGSPLLFHFLMSPLEELHGTLVFFRVFSCAERPEISPFTGIRVAFPGIETVLSAFEFSNHVL